MEFYDLGKVLHKQIGQQQPNHTYNTENEQFYPTIADAALVKNPGDTENIGDEQSNGKTDDGRPKVVKTKKFGQQIQQPKIYCSGYASRYEITDNLNKRIIRFLFDFGFKCHLYLKSFDFIKPHLHSLYTKDTRSTPNP